MIGRVRESRNPKKVIRVSFMESYGEIGRVPVNLYEMYQDDPKIVEVSVESPEYRIREVKRSELYGLKDPIVPGMYQKETYQEIQIPESSFGLNVPWWYEGNAKYYVIDEDMNKLLMMYMKEFFLLEKCQ